MEQNTSNLFELHLDPQSQMYLRETAKWAKFLSIVGFIFCGLFVLAAVFGGAALANMSDQLGTSAPAAGISGAITYIVLAVVTFLPYLFLFRFATQMQTALRNNDQSNLSSSFRNLKTCYQYVGILTIIGLAFFLLMMIFFVITLSTAAGL